MLLSHMITQLQLALLTFFTISAGQILFEDTDERSNRSPNANCVTPENEMGTCVRWTNCQKLRRITNWNRLQPYVCGFAGSEPRVCCSMEQDNPDVLFPTTPPPRRPPPRRTTPPRRRTTTTTTTTTTSRPPPTPFRRPDGDGGTKPRFLPNNCGTTLFTKTRVVGGPSAEQEDAWMAVVFVEKRNGARSPDCGGALVTDRHVVTAAHCVVTGRGSTT
ncbi:Proclotting enzyme like protein [Argiope bruennichi]|uniref:Proclotting enzyme like protein n=1 Tax=Argiope bruennichi TaxID=94029 RepID=A0A8T0FCE6_ARGBR|nr:Proclotting enzyme like protein [Argiope bruennichi]